MPLTLRGGRELSGVVAGGRGLRSASAQLPRGHAVHPSRPVRPGDPADLVLLARGPGDRQSTCCPTSMRQASSRSASARGPRPSCARCWPSCCRSGWRSLAPDGTMANLRRPRSRDARGAAEAPGRSCPTAPRATPRPKSRSAASTPRACRRGPWRRRRCPASTSSARRSTSPAGWAATISSGPGRRGWAAGEAV